MLVFGDCCIAAFRVRRDVVLVRIPVQQRSVRLQVASIVELVGEHGVCNLKVLDPLLQLAILLSDGCHLGRHAVQLRLSLRLLWHIHLPFPLIDLIDTYLILCDM